MPCCVFILLLLLSSSLVPAHKVKPNRPDPAALLQEVAATYAHAADANLHVEVVEESTTSNALMQNWSKTYRTLIRESNNRFRLETRSPYGSWIQVSDGKTEWIYWVDGRSYEQRLLKGAEPTRFRVMFGGVGELRSAWNTVVFVEALAADNLNATLLSDEAITLNGRKFPCYVVHAQRRMENSALSSDRTFWIDKQTHILRKIVEHDKSYQMAGDVHMSVIIDNTTTYPVFDINPEVPNRTFQFTPPTGVKLVDDLRPDWARNLHLPSLVTASVKVHSEPDIQLIESSGKATPLRAYRGKPLLIDLWATWCGPCLVSMPAFGKIAEEYRGSGLVAVSIDEDKDAQSPLDYLKRHGFAWTNYHDSHDAALHAFHSNAIPLVVLIDKDGNILFQEDDGDYEIALRTELAKLFSKIQTPSTH